MSDLTTKDALLERAVKALKEIDAVLGDDGAFLTKIIQLLEETSDLPDGTVFSADTVLSKMIANMNTADGMEFSLTDNSSWYIKFGEKFGGLTVQGGSWQLNNSGSWQAPAYPIEFAHKAIHLQLTVQDPRSDVVAHGKVKATGSIAGYADVYAYSTNSSVTSINVGFLTIGY